MKKYTKERIDMITGMIMKITDMREEDVDALIKNTLVYKNIIRGEECTLYEDYSANLMDIVRELNRKKVESSICGITAAKVSDLNQWMFSNDIENARQLKESIYKSQMIESGIVVDKKVLNVPHHHDTIMGIGFATDMNVQRKKKAVRYRVAACAAAKDIHPRRNKAGKVRVASNRLRKKSARSSRNKFGGRIK